MKILFLLVVLVAETLLFPGAGFAAAADLDSAGCKNFSGMWKPDYAGTYAEFPEMREYMDGENPDPNSFVKGILEARRIVIDCEALTIQAIQGELAGKPEKFNLESVGENEMVINFGQGKVFNAIVRAIKFTRTGELIQMISPEESFVLQRAEKF